MTPDERATQVLNAAVQDGPEYGYVHLDPLLVFAQARHESGDFNSDLTKRGNNVFGMKHPRVRETTSTGADASGYATYASLADSVDDYFLRQRNFGIEDTDNAAAYIAETVASGYAEDPDYAAKWADVYGVELVGGTAELPTPPPVRASVLPLLLVGGALLISWKSQ